MKYYTRKNNKNNKSKKKIYKMSIIIICTILILNVLFYFFDKKIFPIALNYAEVAFKSEAIKIINEESVKIYSSYFDYNDIIDIERDNNNEISMIRSNTVKQNELASKLVLACNKRIQEIGAKGVDVPVSLVVNNTFFINLGPTVNVKMYQVGNTSSSYESTFESAGINQTRHKIYLNLNMKIRIITALKSKDIEISQQIPVSETIIVGKIPQTSIIRGE